MIMHGTLIAGGILALVTQQVVSLSLEKELTVLPTYTETEMDKWFESQGLNYEEKFNETIPDVQPDCWQNVALVGNGNPHQNYYHVQVSENFHCTNGGCSATHIETKTVSWTESAGFSYEWFSGGFAVSEAYTTGNSYTCDGTEGETVCVWWNVAHTAYTVEHHQNPACATPGISPPYVIYSPNTNNVGGAGYCVRGAKYCRSIFAGYWVHSGRAGGP